MKYLIPLILLIFLSACTTTQLTETNCQTDADCRTAGCSGTICEPVTNELTFTTCEFKEEYQCYQEQSCTCINNQCQWKEQDKLNTCLSKY